MPTVAEIPSFAERVFRTLKDGDYLTVRQGQSRERAELVQRLGPDGRVVGNVIDGEDQGADQDIDEMYDDAAGLADALIDLVEGLAGGGTVWVEATHRGARHAHQRVIVDTWETEADADAELNKLVTAATKSGTSLEAMALVKLTTGVLGEIPKVMRELRTAIGDARRAGHREIEASRGAALAAFEAEVGARLEDAEARRRRDEQQNAMMMQLLTAATPALARLVGDAAPPPPPADATTNSTTDTTNTDEPEAMADRALALIKACVAAGEAGKAALRARQSAFVAAVAGLAS